MKCIINCSGDSKCYSDCFEGLITKEGVDELKRCMTKCQQDFNCSEKCADKVFNLNPKETDESSSRGTQSTFNDSDLNSKVSTPDLKVSLAKQTVTTSSAKCSFAFEFSNLFLSSILVYNSFALMF